MKIYNYRIRILARFVSTLSLSLLGSSACTVPAVPAIPAVPATTTPAHEPPFMAKETGDWSFDVTAGKGALQLQVEAIFSPGSGDRMIVDEGAERFVEEVRVATESGWTPVLQEGGAWVAPSCRSGCRLRYRFQLDRAAQTIDDIEYAGRLREALFAPPSTWLLHPQTQQTVGRWTLHVTTAKDTVFLSGLLPSGDIFEATTEDLPNSPYSAFGHFRSIPLSFSGGTLEVAIQEGTFDEQEQSQIVEWARLAGDAVTRYYRRFPVRRVLLFVLPGDQEGVGSGRTLGNGGASILVRLGRPVREQVLRADWVLPHELIHLAFPTIPGHASWLEEGLSTYLEPIVRVHAGQLSEEELWRDFILRMPQGQPVMGDNGLNFTPTWGRTYWGGALFCFLADVEIRKQSNHRHSLGDALRAIVQADGNIFYRWPLERILTVGDQATQTTVLEELYRVHSQRPIRVDLAALWGALGISLQGNRVQRREDAPLASIRRQITEQP